MIFAVEEPALTPVKARAKPGSSTRRMIRVLVIRLGRNDMGFDFGLADDRALTTDEAPKERNINSPGRQPWGKQEIEPSPRGTTRAKP